MKIVSTGNFSGVGWDGSRTDENHITEALEELGHTVYRWQRGENFSHPGQVDFALIAQYDGYPNTLIHDLRMCTDRVVYWAYDHQDQSQEWHNRLIEGSDLYLSKRIADSKYPNWQYLSQDFAPKFLDKHPSPLDKDIDVLFTGSYLPWATERNETLKAVDEKFNLVIHSVNSWEGFKDIRPPIMDEGLPELYARAKVILSIDHTLEAGYWSDRNAQIMCCGRTPLFRYVPLSESTFHEHVLYFYDIEQCLNSIEGQLKHFSDKSWEILGDNSYEFAQENLKVGNRVQDLLIIVGGIL